MSDDPSPPAPSPTIVHPIRPPQRRSADWGSKALLVFLMAVLMAVPGLFVWVLVIDRTHRAESVTQEISQHHGGSQQVLGPMLLVPYTLPRTDRATRCRADGT